MNEVNKTLFIPLYGKAKVSRQNIILNDPVAEKIWDSEAFPIRGKSKSKWLAYNMAMRARVFDDWTSQMLRQNKDALVLHIGCGLDSRCQRVTVPYEAWIDCDFPEVIEIRKRYYAETANYRMMALDASDSEQVETLPDHDEAIVILEGISMYLSHEQLRGLFQVLQAKYQKLHILMYIYTEFAAKASKYKNPVNDVGVTQLYGIDGIGSILAGSNLRLTKEHSLTPAELVDQLKPFDRTFFNLMFTGSLYGKLYRLIELGSKKSMECETSPM